MALRDQPYLPLYVQDYLTDEKLNMCSAAAQGVFIKIMCLMHKSEEYGTIELKAKFKQNKSKIDDFSNLLCRLIPFDKDTIESALIELVSEKVLQIDGDTLFQKRMKKDGEISYKRSISGVMGGKKGRNSGTKRFYNEDGYLYLIYDEDDSSAFKIGISKEPEKRIKGIIRKEKRPNLKFRRRWEVTDMGQAEQDVLDFFEEIRDGEWIFGEYEISQIESQIDFLIKQNKSKIKANTEDEDEYEYDNVNSNWKSSFEIYLNELNEVYNELITDQNFIQEQERFNPGVDISLSLEKAKANFWGKEAGWKHKKKSRTKTIDWKQTFINAIPLNKVPKKYGPTNQTSYRPDKNAETIRAAENLQRELAAESRKQT